MELNREQIAGILEIIANSHYGNFYIISPAQMLLLTKIIKELIEENERLRACTNLVPTLNEVKADTVRKMQTEIESRCIKGGIYPAFVKSTIDQIVKEIMEGKNAIN